MSLIWTNWYPFRVLQVVLAPSMSEVSSDFSVAVALLVDHSAHLAVGRRSCHSRRKIHHLNTCLPLHWSFSCHVAKMNWIPQRTHLYLMFVWPRIVTNSFVVNQLDALISHFFKFWNWNSTCFGEFLCPSSGVFHYTQSNGIYHTGWLTTCEEGMCFCSQAVNKIVWYVTLLCIQWKTPNDWQRNCPKHVDFQFENKNFENLVHLFGLL